MKAAKELVHNSQGFFLVLPPILYWADRKRRVFLKFSLKQEMVDGWINEIKFPLLYPATLLSCATKKWLLARESLFTSMSFSCQMGE